jgi:hypothetical protein
MRASQEAALLQRQPSFKSQSASEKKPFSQKDFKEDSDVNDREYQDIPDDAFFQVVVEANEKKRKNSDERQLMNDASKRAIGEKSAEKSILKHASTT